MNRRKFLTASTAAGFIGAPFRGTANDAKDTPPLKLTKEDLPTPALLVDLDAFEANLKKMAAHCRATGRAFRPHAKTHKCPEIAKRQIASGANGICVATVPEAEAMVAAGIRGVLLTSPILERRKIARMVQLARSGGDVLLSVGDQREAELLSEAAAAAKVTMNVLVDIDVIDRRTGALPGQPAVELARFINRRNALRLRGVQAYAGAASHTPGFSRREQVSREAMSKAVETRELMARAGLEAPLLSGGSTGTYNIDSEISGVTELQVGSYIFMDTEYMAIGGKDGNKVYSDFQPALTVLTTVVSATHSDQVTVDAGVKAFAHSPDPLAKGREGLKYRRSGDEFGAVTAISGAALPRLGERLEFIVPHCDPTVNLYDRLYACRGEQVEAIWPVTARRESPLPSQP